MCGFFGGERYAVSRIYSGHPGHDELCSSGPGSTEQKSIDRSASVDRNGMATCIYWTSRRRSGFGCRDNRHPKVRRRRKSERIDGLQLVQRYLSGSRRQHHFRTPDQHEARMSGPECKPAGTKISCWSRSCKQISPVIKPTHDSVRSRTQRTKFCK